MNTTDTIREALRRCPATENGWALGCAEDYGNTVWFWSKPGRQVKYCGLHYATVAMTAAWLRKMLELGQTPRFRRSQYGITVEATDFGEFEEADELHALAAAVCAVLPEPGEKTHSQAALGHGTRSEEPSPCPLPGGEGAEKTHGGKAGGLETRPTG